MSPATRLLVETSELTVNSSSTSTPRTHGVKTWGLSSPSGCVSTSTGPMMNGAAPETASFDKTSSRMDL